MVPEGKRFELASMLPSSLRSMLDQASAHEAASGPYQLHNHRRSGKPQSMLRRLRTINHQILIPSFLQPR